MVMGLGVEVGVLMLGLEENVGGGGTGVWVRRQLWKGGSVFSVMIKIQKAGREEWEIKKILVVH